MILPDVLRAAHRKMSDDFIFTLYKVTKEITKGINGVEKYALEVASLESSISAIVCSTIATLSQSEDTTEISKAGIELLRTVADAMEEHGTLGQKVTRGEILKEDS